MRQLRTRRAFHRPHGGHHQRFHRFGRRELLVVEAATQLVRRHRAVFARVLMVSDQHPVHRRQVVRQVQPTGLVQDLGFDTEQYLDIVVVVRHGPDQRGEVWGPGRVPPYVVGQADGAQTARPGALTFSVTVLRASSENVVCTW